MQQLIIIRGYPGSGKTTIGKMLHKERAGCFIDHHKILSAVADIAGNDEGIYDEIHSLEQTIAWKLLNEGKSVIAARGFSTVQSMEPYFNIAKERKVDYRVLRLEAPLEVLKSRVVSSERREEFNPTMSADTLIKWVEGNKIESFSEEIIIDATQPIEQVVRTIKTAIQ